MSNIQKQHKISPAIAWLTIQKFIIFYCPLDGEHTNVPGVFELIIRIRLLRSFQVKDGIRYYNYAACAD